MTIEMDVVAEHGEVIKIGSVLPGEFGSFTDFSNGSRNTLVVHCLDDDIGGEVYCIENDSLEENVRYRAVPLELFTAQNLEVMIAPGGHYEREVVTRFRQFGRLILTHIATPQNF